MPIFTLEINILTKNLALVSIIEQMAWYTDVIDFIKRNHIREDLFRKNYGSSQ
jgi:hypothetical protein